MNIKEKSHQGLFLREDRMRVWDWFINPKLLPHLLDKDALGIPVWWILISPMVAVVSYHAPIINRDLDKLTKIRERDRMNNGVNGVVRDHAFPVVHTLNTMLSETWTAPPGPIMPLLLGLTAENVIE